MYGLDGLEQSNLTVCKIEAEMACESHTIKLCGPCLSRVQKIGNQTTDSERLSSCACHGIHQNGHTVVDPEIYKEGFQFCTQL